MKPAPAVRTVPWPRHLFRAGIGSILILTAMLGSGCMGYRVGGHLPPGVASIFVPTVINDSGEPQLEAEVTTAIIERIQSDGRLEILAAESADAHLQVRITGSAIAPLRYDRDDTVTATEYRLTLIAETTLIRIRDEKRLLDRHIVEGWTDFRTTGDLPASRREAIPEASLELGRQVVRTIVEYW